MFSLIALTLFNGVVLLAPPHVISVILELMPVPFTARVALLWAVAINVLFSVAYERWGVHAVSHIVGLFVHDRRRRTRDGKTYKAVEGGPR